MDEKKKVDLNVEFEELKRGQEQTLIYLREHGYELSLGEWLTVKRYAQKFEMTVEQVKAGIESGVIPVNCVEFLDVAGGITVIKDRPYTSKA